MTSPSGSSTVTQQDANGTWIIALDGEHDISTTPVLDEQIRGRLPRCTLAIVDLSSTTFIDASVIGWLMRTRGALATGTNALSVVRGNPGGIADRIFDILRLHTELPVYSTRKDALAHTDPLAKPPELLHVSSDVDPSARGRRRGGEVSHGG